VTGAGTRSRAERRLTARQVETYGPGLHHDGGGLYLVVSDTRRRWVLRYKSPTTGKRVEMGLGAAKRAAKDPTGITLDEARAGARQAHDMLRKGLDPLTERDRLAAEIAAEASKAPPKTFGAWAEDWLAENVTDSAFRNAKHRAQWGSTLRNYAKLLWNKPLASIATDDVLAALKPIWKTKPETAKRTQGRIEKLLDAARAAGLREGDNPARWRGHLSLLLPKRAKAAHHPALPYEKAPAVLAELRKREGVAARALEFAVLTAARSGEVRGMTWGELDAERKVWTVPASRMKAGLEHRVPLTDRARAILAEMDMLRTKDRASKALVFPGQRTARSKVEVPPLSDMTLSAVLKRMREGEGEGAEARQKLLQDAQGNDVVVHGFRSTFRDWAEDKARFPARVVEHALAHTIKNAAERAYRHGDALDQRVELMAAWEGYLDGAAGAKVVPMRRRS
jgi:integrase